MDAWYYNNEGALRRFQDALRRACHKKLRQLHVLTFSQQEEILDKIEDAWFEGKISGFECSSAPGTAEYEKVFINYLTYNVLPKKAVDYLRVKRNRQADNVDDLMEETVLGILGEASGTPQSIIEQSQLSKILQNCASRLSDSLAEVYAHYIKDLTQQEIADELRIKIGTVKSRTSEMIRKLGDCVRAATGGEQYD